jgi:uncharacterized repeat protein (TIGR01451 family)
MNLKPISLSFILVAIHLTTFAQINWESTNGPEGGTFWSVYGDGEYVFVSDEYHFFRTNDGFNWEQLPDGNIWPLATSPDKLAAGKGFGYNYGASDDPKFVVSYDHGATWIEGVMPPTTYGIFTSIAVCSHGIYVPDGYSSKIFRTQDDGLTWDSIPPPGMYCYDVWAFEDRLYAEWFSKFWRLSLNGVDWEVVSPQFGNNDYPMSMFASDSLLFFATERNLWCSSDSGSSWTKTPIPFHNSDDDFCRIGNRIYRSGGQTGIMYTDDFGHTWQGLPIPNYFNTYDLAQAGGQLLCGNYNKGVLRYDASSQQLVTANEGLNSAAVFSMDSGNGYLWAGCGNGVFAYDLNAGAWVDKALLPLPTYNYESVSVSPEGKIATSQLYGNSIYLSMDSGASWDTITPTDAQGWGWISINKIFWLGENIFLQSEWQDDAWSNDLGQTWVVGYIPESITFFNGRYYGVSWSVGLVSSDDFGQSWQPASGPNVPSIRTLYATDDKLFALTYSAGRNQIYSTSDGINWTCSSDGLPQIDIIDPNEYYNQGSIWRKGSRYYLHDQSIGFFTSLDSCKTWLPVERNVYEIMHSTDTTFYKAGFGGGVLKTGLPQNYGALSTGYVFSDVNNNGLWDPTELALPNLKVFIKEPGAWYPYWFTYSESDGSYAIGSSPGSIDTIRVSVPSGYVENINPPEYVVTNSGNDRNFGVQFKPDITDVSIAGYFTGHPRPGFPLNTTIVYKNEGTVAASGVISVKLDPRYQFISADPPPTAFIGVDSLIWDFNPMPLFDQQRIHINGKVDSTTLLGSVFRLSGHIEPSVSDYMPANNDFIRADTVVGSYDPNEKAVEPARGLTPTEIAEGKELIYTVYFQNTGTFQADRVRITDLLDSALNASTLRLVASSHPVSLFRLLPGNLLEIIFNDIALPDSNQNEPASHGFVSFAIQRKTPFNQAYEIQNWAAIYFDFNEPIITNTVITPVVLPSVSTLEPNWETVERPGLLISPNPTANDIRIETLGSLSGPGDIILINAQGQVCLATHINELANPVEIALRGLANGAYFVRATGRQGVMFGKLVIAR